MRVGIMETPAVLDATTVDRDQLLVRNFLAGDQTAFDELVAKYQPYIYNICLQMLDNPADAEDVTQNALVAAYRALPRFRMESRFSTWMYRIAINQCLSYRRRQRPEMSLERDIPEGSARFEEVDKRETVRKLIQTLAPHFRAVIVLRYYRQLSYEEIAEVLGWTPDKVKCYLHRARNVFKKAYRRELEGGGSQ